MEDRLSWLHRQVVLLLFSVTIIAKCFLTEGDEKDWEPVWVLKGGEGQEGGEEKIENLTEKISNVDLK